MAGRCIECLAERQVFLLNCFNFVFCRILPTVITNVFVVWMWINTSIQRPHTLWGVILLLVRLHSDWNPCWVAILSRTLVCMWHSVQFQCCEMFSLLLKGQIGKLTGSEGKKSPTFSCRWQTFDLDGTGGADGNPDLPFFVLFFTFLL